MNLGLADTGALANLKKYSQILGQDPLLVQGAGGNTSLKLGQIMWVKASGKWLAKASSEDIFVPVDLRDLANAADDSAEPTISLASGVTSQLRPSIETTLHSVLPHKVVLHVHPVTVLALATRADAYKQLQERVADFKWSLIPYVKPGWLLAREVYKSWQATPGTNVFILQNHGLVVAAETFDEAYSTIQRVVSACDVEARKTPEVDDIKIQQWLVSGATSGDMRAVTDTQTHALALDPVCYKYCGSAVLYPDQAVFLGATLLGNPTENRYQIVKDIGVFIAKDAPRGTEEMLLCHAQVLRRVPSNATMNPLSEASVCELLNWDAEKYRQGKAV